LRIIVVAMSELTVRDDEGAKDGLSLAVRDGDDAEFQEAPFVMLDGASIAMHGVLKVAQYGREEMEPEHDVDDLTSDEDDAELVIAEVADDAHVDESDDSDAEYEEVLDHEDSAAQQRGAAEADKIRQSSVLAMAEQFIGYAQMFTLISHPIIDMVDDKGVSKWPMEYVQLIVSWMSWCFHFIIPDFGTALFSHIDPDYKRVAMLFIRLCFPWAVLAALCGLWSFRAFNAKEAYEFACHLTFMGAVKTTLIYVTIAGAVAGVSIAVMDGADVRKGEDWLWVGLSATLLLWLLHMAGLYAARRYFAERTKFVKPSMVLKEISTNKTSLCMFLLLVTYLPVCYLVLRSLQPVFRQSWEQAGYRGVSCYFRSLEPVAHPLYYRDAHPVLECMSIYGMLTFTLASLLVPCFVVALPILVHRLIVSTRNMVIEQGWLRDFFLYEEQRQEVSKNMGFLPTRVWLKFYLKSMVAELPPLQDVQEEIAMLHAIDDGEFTAEEEAAEQARAAEKAGGMYVLGGKLAREEEMARMFSSAPPPGLLFELSPEEYSLLSVREKREQQLLRGQELVRQKKLRQAEAMRQAALRKLEKKKQREQVTMDEINRQPEKRDFMVKLARTEPLVELEYARAEIMGLEALRKFVAALQLFQDEHLLTEGNVRLDTSGVMYLFKAFEFEFYFWKPLEMLERAIIVVLVCFLEENQFVQISTIALVISVGLAVSLKYRPFIDPVQDQIDLMCRAALLLNIIAAMFLQQDYIDKQHASLILILINVGSLIVLGNLFNVQRAPRYVWDALNGLVDSYVVHFLFAQLSDPGLRILRRWDAALGFWECPTVASTALGPVLGSVPGVGGHRWWHLMRFNERGRHLLLKWDARLAVRRHGADRARHHPASGAWFDVRWAAHRDLRLSRVRYCAGVTLLHIAMAKPEVRVVKWLVAYDVTGRMYRAKDLDGNVAFMGALEELSTLLADIEAEPANSARRRHMMTRRGKFAQMLLSEQVLARGVPWEEHSFARLDVLAQDVALACGHAPARSRTRVGQWRKHPHNIQAFLAQLYLGAHRTVNLKGDYLGPVLGMHFAIALQTNRSALRAELPQSNLRPDVTKTAAIALGGDDHCALTSLNLSGNNVGPDAGKALAKAMKQGRGLKSVDLSWNNIGGAGAKAIGAALRRWDNSVEVINLEGNQIGYDGANSMSVSIKRRGSTVRALNLAHNNMGPGGSTTIAAAMWKRSALVTSLNISHNQLGEEGGKAFCMAIKKNKHLAALWIAGNRLGPDIGLQLAKALRVNAALTFIDMSCNELGNAFGTMFASILHQNATWTSVDMSCNGLRGDTCTEIAEAMCGNKSLTAVNLSDNAFEHEAAQHLAAMLESPLNTLTDLDLSRNNIEGDRSLADALHTNNALTQLDLNDNTLGPMAGHALGLALKRSTSKLKMLHLRGAMVGVEGGKSLASALESHRHLLVLDLEDNKLGAVGATAIGLSLEENASVTSLNVASNDIGPEGGAAFAGTLVMNHTLTSLTLRNNAIGTEAGASIAAELEVNTTLVFIDLEQNELGPWFGRRLADSLQTNTTIDTLVLGRNELGHEKRGSVAPVLSGRALAQVFVQKSSSVTWVDLNSNRLGPRSGLALAEMLKSDMCVVTTLLMADNLLGEEAGEAVASAMLQNQLLTTLDMGNNRIGPNAGVIFAAVVARSSTLTSLNLERNQLGAAGGVPIFDSLLDNIGLTSLDVSGNKLGPRVVPSLMELFEKNTTLANMDLSNNELGSESFEQNVELAKAFGKNKGLVFLNLDSNRLGRKAGHQIARSLVKNDTIEVLGLTNNRMDAEVGFNLLRALTINTVIHTINVHENEVGREAFADIQKTMNRRVSRKKPPPKREPESEEDYYDD